MKKLCNVFIVLALLLACGMWFSTKAEAASYNGFTYTVSDGEATITDYTGSATDLTIPSTLDGYPVTSIGDWAFAWCVSRPTSVAIPDSVTSIGDWAFAYCEVLPSVAIPDSVTSIGDYAFSDCYSLTSVAIPDSVTSIGNYAFNYCTSLAGIWVSEGNAYYSSDAQGVLFNKDKTELIQAPGTINGSYVIPDSVTSIGEYAFEFCEALTSVTIGGSVTSIGDYAFCHCYFLTSVTIPDSVTTIGEGAFYNCEALISVTIGNSVTTIGDYAFSECCCLTDVYYAGTQEQWNAISIYKGNSYLTDATIHYNYHDHDYTKVPAVVVDPTCTADGYIEYTCVYGETYRETLVALGHDYSGTAIVTPPTCTEQGNTVTQCIRCDSTQTTYQSKLGHDYSGTAIVTPPTCTEQGYTTTQCIRCESTDKSHYTDAVGHSFTNYISNNDATGYADATKTAKCDNCDATDTISIEGTKLPSVANGTCGKNLVWWLDASGTLTISGTGPMDNYGYDYDYDDTYYTDAPWFNFATTITMVIIEDGVTTIGDYAFGFCYSLTSVTIGDGVTTVGSSAFENCFSLTDVYITDIAAWCGISFAASYSSPLLYAENLYLNNKLVTDLAIPDSVTRIGSYAFRNCTSLTSVTIPDSVTSIGGYAFEGCNALTSVTIPDSVTSIGQNAFYGCDSLKSVTIPDSVTWIGRCAFRACYSLTSVTIPDSVIAIGDCAFMGCPRLTDVYYAGTQTQWNAIDIDYENEILTSATIHYNHIHDYTLFPTVTVESTCTEPGYIEYTCIYGETYREYIPALGHIAGADFVVTPPTCTAEGYTTFVCDRCGETFTTDYVAALGHDYSGTQTVVAPTCTEEGYTGTKCIHCDSVQKTDIVAATGHKMALVPAVAPTCTETGLTVGSGCQYCGLVGVAQKEVAATGHSYVDHEAKTPTCTEIGWEAYQTCENCDYSSYAELPVATHSPVDHAGQAATCTEPGWEAYQTCENCDYTTFAEIPATGIHNHIVFVQTISAGCTEQGYTVYKCEHCDSTENRDYTNVLGHNVVIDPAVDPTCTEPGWTMGTHCDRCGMVGFAQTEIPTIDHSYVDHEAKVPTCTEPGWEAYQTCENCDYNTCVEIFADHNFVDGSCSGCGFAVKAEITTVVLRPSATGIYFKGAFDSDEVVSAQRRGIAVSVANASPVADDSDPTSLYTIGYNSVLIKNILDSSDGETFIYARAYVLLSDGTYVYGKTVAISLKMLLEEIDTKWNGVSTAQQKALFDMCSNYLAVTADWNIPNIHAAISAYCPHCDAYVDWTDWGGTAATGHFRMTEDVVLSEAVQFKNSMDFVLDLNGKTITADGCRAFNGSSGATLSIVDTVGTGVITGGNSSGGRGGNIYASGANVKLYGGTIINGTAAADGNMEGHNVAVYNGAFVINGNVVIGNAADAEKDGHSLYLFNATSVELTQGNVNGGLLLRGVNIALSNQLIVDRITMRNATFTEVENRADLAPIAVQIVDGKQACVAGAFTAVLNNADAALAYFVSVNPDYEIINNNGKLELA